MFRSIREKITNKNEMYLHKKRVEIRKITPAKWRQLFSTVDKLPGLIVQVLSAPPGGFYMTILQALDIALDEVVEVVSVMTGVDKEYIDDHVGLDEILEYLTRMVEYNRLDNVAKNVKSLLPKERM